MDIPIEHEAQLQSKKAAVALLGADMVTAHAQLKIDANHDRGKWEFFQALSVNDSFNVLEATKPWVDKYRSDLQALEQNISPKYQVDFKQQEWWR
jgi:hypothetical protein